MNQKLRKLLYFTIWGFGCLAKCLVVTGLKYEHTLAYFLTSQILFNIAFCFEVVNLKVFRWFITKTLIKIYH